MKKLLILIYIVCLTASAVHSQEPYCIDKVVLTVNNYNSKAPVFVKNLNDSVQIVSSEWDFPILPVFKTVTLADNKISSVELLSDGNKYNWDQEKNILMLSEILEQQEETSGAPQEEEKVIETANGFQFPAYTIQQSGNKLTITFDHVIYGFSKYPGQTLEGKCEMIYVKP